MPRRKQDRPKQIRLEEGAEGAEGCEGAEGAEGGGSVGSKEVAEVNEDDQQPGDTVTGKQAPNNSHPHHPRHPRLPINERTSRPGNGSRDRDGDGDGERESAEGEGDTSEGDNFLDKSDSNLSADEGPGHCKLRPTSTVTVAAARVRSRSRSRGPLNDLPEEGEMKKGDDNERQGRDRERHRHGADLPADGREKGKDNETPNDTVDNDSERLKPTSSGSLSSPTSTPTLLSLSVPSSAPSSFSPHSSSSNLKSSQHQPQSQHHFQHQPQTHSQSQFLAKPIATGKKLSTSSSSSSKSRHRPMPASTGSPAPAAAVALVSVKREPEEDSHDVGIALDFSIKSNKKAKKSGSNGPSTGQRQPGQGTKESGECPLDLSLKRQYTPPPNAGKLAAKVPRMESASSASPWNYSPSRTMTPPKSQMSRSSPSPSGGASPVSAASWNGSKLKGSGGGSGSLLNNKSLVSSSSASSQPSAGVTRSGSSHGRQNPWQTQWINRSSEQTRDVFTCVWCKESFRSLQEMTEHMKASPRCGMAGMQQAAANAASVSALTTSGHGSSHGAPGHSNAGHAAHSASSTNNGANQGSGSGKEPMSSAVLAKNNVNLPRKLVRGQDVWLGRGAEQTRQILKCMWCGQSFKTLDDMTKHMRVTQHYTNIISQEQIISWRTPEDKLAQAQVNAVLTCKVCDEAFGSLKELSYHMVKNAHYKEHILRSITEGGHGRRRQTRERRKKSLPVRKLLELERMEMTPTTPSPAKPSASPSKRDKDREGKSGHSKGSSRKEGHATRAETPTRGSSAASSSASSSIISCDECNEKVDAKHFVAHLKVCKSHSSVLKSDAADLRSPGSSTTGSRPGSGPPSRPQTVSPPGGQGAAHERCKSGKKREKEEKESGDEREEEGDSEGEKSPSPERSSGSVLSAIERLIEKSFDSKSKKNHTTGILQRLGIDEEVCPPWQHMAGAQGMGPFHPWVSGQPGTPSNKGRNSASPVPSVASSSFAKENGSLCSPSSSCEDSNSCASLSPPSALPSTLSSSQPAKLSFPISSLIANNEETSSRRLRSVSPHSSVHSNSNSPAPSTVQTPPPAPTPTPPIKSLLGAASTSESEEERKSKPKAGRSKRTKIDQKHTSTRKRSDSLSSGPDGDISRSPFNPIKSPSTDTESPAMGSSSGFHPLMELQKLLDKTDSGSKKMGSSGNSGIAAKLAASSGPSSLLAFNWAFSESTPSSAQSPPGQSHHNNHNSHRESHRERDRERETHRDKDQSTPSTIKCAFCETQFVSKGAYRHHLSKMHFINNHDKEGREGRDRDRGDAHPNHGHGHSHGQSHSHGNSNNNNSGDKSGNRQGKGQGQESASADGQAPGQAASAPESPHSKFLKYTELAKQLSSKYV